MTTLVNVLYPIALAYILVSIGYEHGRRRTLSRMADAIRSMAQNAEEISPVAPVLGMDPVFVHGTWLAFGKPSKRLLKKFKVPACPECGHHYYTHRATVTMLSTSETIAGEKVPIIANMICKVKGCDCVQQVADGEVAMPDHRESDSE